MTTELDIELHHEETAWAAHCGFWSAAEYHRASDELFAESVREYDGDE